MNDVTIEKKAPDNDHGLGEETENTTRIRYVYDQGEKAEGVWRRRCCRAPKTGQTTPHTRTQMWYEGTFGDCVLARLFVDARSLTAGSTNLR